MTKKFVKQKTGAGGYLLPAPTEDTVSLKQDTSQQESSQWKNHRTIWSTEMYYFLFHNWSSLTKIISSFPSLQDVKTVLFNDFI
jgi:hypothetical protein